MTGLINLDKPAGISSAGAVARVKHLLPRGTKIGHAGTLDPFATGVLVLLVGKATRFCEQVMGQPKQYETVIKLGATTDTLDPTHPETIDPAAAPMPREAIDAILPQFIGAIQQLPPAFSALKIAGRPAYKLALKGEAVDLKPRTVQVYGIEVMEYAWPLLKLRIDCGRGTYIRALARDIAAALATTGYLMALRRTRVGPYLVTNATTLDRLAAEGVEGSLLPVPPPAA